jgi:hypothetical protein
MTLDEEITAVETLVHAGRAAATEHLERATKDLHLGSTGLAYYKDFLDATLLNARSTLARCRELVAAPAISAEVSASIAQGLLAGARESMRLMYVAMVVVEQLAGSARRGGIADATERAALRSCSFCGKTEAESKLVAGPVASICASCARLACGVLGMTVAESETE